MNDHNLDDLIIDNIEPSHSKTKSFLTIVALFIVFLIVGIILAKIYTKETNNATLTLEEDNSEFIAPELKLQVPAKVAKVKEETSLSTIIEQEIKAPEVKTPEVKAPEVKSKEAVPVEKPADPIVTQEAVETTKEIVKTTQEPVKTTTETVQITQEFTQKPQLPEVPKPIIKEAEIPKPIDIPKPVEAVVAPKEIPKTVTDASYYIQVGSFTQSPSTRFLSVIKNSGFDYTITKPTSKGIKKLLIGPYPNRAAVDTALIQVRDRINKQAFVVKK